MTELTKRIFTSFFLLFILYLSFTDLKIILISLFFINFLVIDEFIKIFKKINKTSQFMQFLTIFLTIIYMVYFTLTIVLFLIESFDLNKVTVLFLLIICISSDIGGYVFGKIIGGKKLTKISPNKTYAGLFGSIILSLIIGYLFHSLNYDILVTKMNLFFFIIIISLISQIGDLIISIFKRMASIKDTGSFLPGHGGILDRFDGILLSIPLGIILFNIFL